MKLDPDERLDWGRLDEIRRTPGASTLLFITDRCPVECAHCSVDSRRDSPMISDFAKFEAVLDWICGQPSFGVVGVSGGEPFVERRGLQLAAKRITEAGKHLVVYTSGVWATRPTPPAWVSDVLGRCSTVFLSTDGFHAERVPDDRYVNAARSAADAGAWIVVQVIEEPAMVVAAQALLTRALGTHYEDYAELHLIQALTSGRGEQVFFRQAATPGRVLGACPSLASPMVRYDGAATACCNESVIMGRGPVRLRRTSSSAKELDRAIEGFRSDPLLVAIGGVGLGTLTSMPRFQDLAAQRFVSICDLCWKICDRVGSGERTDPLLDAVAGLVGVGP